jgi:uncharacterized protein (TIGR02449 family)
MGYSFQMQKELDSLSNKIQLVSELCLRLRRENQSLRQELATSQQEVKLLNTKLETAKSRLDSVINKIPG